MSTLALSRHPSRAAAAISGIVAFAMSIFRRIGRRMKLGKDRRAVQAMPDSLLADLGLERIEIRTADGHREVWTIPHRYR